MRRGTLFGTLAVLMCSIVSNAGAQSFAVDRGVWQVGGSASFSSDGSPGAPSDSRTTTLSFAPALAYFILPGVAVGASVLVAHTGTSFGHADIYGVGPEITYYFGRGPRRVYPFLAASAVFAWAHTSSTGSFDAIPLFSDHYRTAVYTGRAGIAALLARNVAVTGNAYYADYRYYYVNDGSYYVNDGSLADRAGANSYGVQFGMSVFVY